MDEISFRPPREPLVAPGEMDCHVADMTATISADMPLGIAQQRLGQFHQWIPIDGDENLPIGRLVSENSTGPLRLGYGAWRDLLLGCQFRIGSGELITAGGQTIKNVAGYDLTKLMIGQRGLLGKIVTLTLRAYRKPAGALLAVMKPDISIIPTLVASPLRPRWALLNADKLLLGWLDEEVALDFFERRIKSYHPEQILRRTIAEDIAHRSEMWKQPGTSFRAAVPPSAIQAFTQSAKPSQWRADAAFGIVLGTCAEGDFDRIESSAETVGGSATLFIPGQPPRWKIDDNQARIMRDLRGIFDARDGHGTIISKP